MAEVKIRNKRFIYKDFIKWQSQRKGLLSSSGKPDIEVATPPEFKGHQGKWSPEDLFVASVNACIMTTFLYYAEKEGLEFLGYQSQAQGVLERVGDKFIFSQIEIRPHIFVKKDTDIQKVKDIMALSEKSCLISNSIKSKVEVIPDIEHKEMAI